MKVTDWVAIIALIISTAGFMLQFLRWLDEGPKLKLSVMADAVFIPARDDRDMLALTVINRGSVSTVITHMIAFTYDSRWKRLRNKASMSAIVNSTLQPIPSPLGVNEKFMGSMAYDDRTRKARADGRLYVGVVASHTNKEFLIHVPPAKSKQDLKKVIA
jgi:hypothetical protein